MIWKGSPPRAGRTPCRPPASPPASAWQSSCIPLWHNIGIMSKLLSLPPLALLPSGFAGSLFLARRSIASLGAIWYIMPYCATSGRERARTAPGSPKPAAPPVPLRGPGLAAMNGLPQFPRPLWLSPSGPGARDTPASPGRLQPATPQTLLRPSRIRGIGLRRDCFPLPIPRKIQS